MTPSATAEDLSAVRIQRVVAEVAGLIDADQPSLARSMSQLMAHEIDQLDGDPLLRELLHASVDGNIKTILHILANDIPVEHLTPTTAAVEYALRLAQRGIPSSSLMRAYHMGQDSFRRQAYQTVQASGYSAAVQLAVLERIAQVIYTYIDRITQLVLAEYDSERDRWSSAQGNVLASLIHALLAGDHVNRQAFAVATPYQLEQNHLGVIAWHTGDEPGPETHRSLEAMVRQLAGSLLVHGPVLFSAVDRSTAWAWLPLGGAVRLPEGPTTSYRPEREDHRVAIGLPSYGVAGFRRTHEQAVSAHTLAVAAPQRTGAAISFGDPGVAITALLAQLPEVTRGWVEAVLGSLATDDDAHRVLRETLRVFLSTGENYARTAEVLVVHRNTVKYRLGKIVEERERTLGRSLDDRLDVALALQACHYLGSLVLTPAVR